MTSKLRRMPDSSKSAGCPEGNQKPAGRPQAVAARQRIVAALDPQKKAEHLHYLTKAGFSTCQKLVAGNRLPNEAIYEALFDSDLIIDVVLGLAPENSTNPKVRAVRKALRRLELDFEDEEIGR